MWQCPVCLQKFRNTNQSHSCRQGTVESFLEGKTEISIELYKHFISEYRKIGSYEVHPAKTRIALASRIRFAAVNKLGKDFLDGHLVLLKDFSDSGCFNRVDQFGNSYVHNFRIRNVNEINDEMKDYMIMAFNEAKQK